MHSAISETTTKMLAVVNCGNYHGKLIYLMIRFLDQTGASSAEAASLTIGDIRLDHQVKKAFGLGQGPRQRTQIIDSRLRKTLDALLLQQVCQGLRLQDDSPLFRTASDKALTADQMACLLWLYQEAAALESQETASITGKQSSGAK